MEFQLLIKTKILTNRTFLAFKLSDVVFITLINVKMPKVVSSVEQVIFFITLRPNQAVKYLIKLLPLQQPDQGRPLAVLQLQIIKLF